MKQVANGCWNCAYGLWMFSMCIKIQKCWGSLDDHSGWKPIGGKEVRK